MHTPIKAALCATFVLAATAVAPAAVILTTADGQGADSFASNDGNQAATTSHGDSTTMAIRHYDTVRAKAAYLRFDLSNVAGDLSGATLTLYFSNANRTRTMNVNGLTDESLDAWAEADLAYNNAPGVIQPADGIYNNGLFDLDTTKLSVASSFTTPSSNANSITTAADPNFDAFLASDTNGLVTLVLYTASSDSSQSFFVATKEYSDDPAVYPTLTLPNATLTPEPASLSLLALTSLAALRRRRK